MQVRACARKRAQGTQRPCHPCDALVRLHAAARGSVAFPARPGAPNPPSMRAPAALLVLRERGTKPRGRPSKEAPAKTVMGAETAETRRWGGGGGRGGRMPAVDQRARLCSSRCPRRTLGSCRRCRPSWGGAESCGSGRRCGCCPSWDERRGARASGRRARAGERGRGAGHGDSDGKSVGGVSGCVWGCRRRGARAS